LNQNAKIAVNNKNELQYKLLFWSLCSMFFFIPVAKSPAIISGLAALIIWIMSGIGLKRSPLLIKQTCFLPVFVLMILIWLGLLNAENINYELKHVKRSYYWLYVFAVASLPFARVDAEKLLKAFLAGLTFTAILSIMQYADLAPMRAHALPMGLLSGFHHIILSLYLVFGILVLSFYFKRASSKKAGALIICLMVVCFIDLTLVVYGRSGYAAFLLLSPIVIYNLLGKKNLLIMTAILAIILTVFLLSPKVQERIGHAKDDITKYSAGDTNTSLGLRLEMWKISAQLFLENPLIGTGSSGFQSSWERNIPYQDAIYFQTPHNTFLYVASAYGIPGIITIIWLFIVLFRSGWRNKDTVIGFSILSFALVFFIGSLVNTMILGSAKTAWVTVFIGLQGALNDK
jgi:O-antigen ligase